MNIELIENDCFEYFKNIPDHSIDCVVTDPPYGTTPLHWDQGIDFKRFWNEIDRVTKEDAAIIVFAQEPFASMLRCSNMKMYKYDWYWEKERLTNIFQVKKRCGKTVENICVFYKKQPTYNPQKSLYTGKPVSNKIGKNAKWSVTQAGYNQTTKPFEYVDDGTRHPTQVLRFNRDNPRHRLHPTQKPVPLLEYLIRTYTNEKMVVLDPFMGSGSTGIACKNTNRSFIGIELDKEYFNIAQERIC